VSLGRHGAIQISWRMVSANARQIKRKNCVVSRQFADIHAPAEGTAKQAVKENHGRSRTGLKIFDFLALDFRCLICSLHSFRCPFDSDNPIPIRGFKLNVTASIASDCGTYPRESRIFSLDIHPRAANFYEKTQEYKNPHGNPYFRSFCGAPHL
jgi:hypothetical protein